MQEKLINITNQIIRLKELVAMTGLSRSTIYDKQNPKSPRFDPSFPQKISLGTRAVGWFQREVEAWLNSMKNKHTFGGDRD